MYGSNCGNSKGPLQIGQNQFKVARQECTLLAPHPVKISKLEAYRRCFTPLERSGKKKSVSPLRIGRIGRTDSDRQDRPGQTEQAKTDSDRQDRQR
jgi:hypothetical protein